ncbi:hypothetical protein Q2T40_18500 [Winogradskyella maritima]|uniref:Restriction endonuclease n=1 Tax=Winogradskyella maritima TaxID=1517766 RepID=A0ABV8AEW6_9FLAO|nr:hypothetical protein [Winogradskyella maritima]
MKPLTYKAPNTYVINSKRAFLGNGILKASSIKNAFEFAYEMTFGKGHHRDYRSGGQSKRRQGELFSNVFQGKLAEEALYHFLIPQGVTISEIDYRVMGKSAWDDSDFVVNNKYINVKSAAFFSNLLLLEEKDWNKEGQYIPNLENGSKAQYDIFVLIRLKPDIKGLLRREKLMFSGRIEKEKLKHFVNAEMWHYDIPGFMTHSDFVNNVIAKNQSLPQNAMLNGKIKMDASNYYVQCGELRKLEELYKFL